MATDIEPDHAKPAGALTENSLKAAGWGYVIGDISLTAAKHMEGDSHGASGAAIWLAGGLAAGFYGNPKAEKQLQLFEHRLGAYLRKQGVQIPQNPTVAELAKEDGIISHINAFMYAHPAEMLNAAYAIGGALSVKGAIHRKTPMDIIGGSIITAGALAGVLIKEKKPDPEHRTQGLATKAWQWIQEKPLRVPSAFYLANNVPMLLEARKKQKEGSSSCMFRYLTVASYVFSNIMMSISSKDNLSAKNDAKQKQVMEHLADEAAIVIAAQPKEVQDALVQNIAGYLAGQPEIKQKPDELAALLHEKLATARSQMASAPVSWQQSVLQPGPGISPSI